MAAPRHAALRYGTRHAGERGGGNALQLPGEPAAVHRTSIRIHRRGKYGRCGQRHVAASRALPTTGHPRRNGSSTAREKTEDRRSTSVSVCSAPSGRSRPKRPETGWSFYFTCRSSSLGPIGRPLVVGRCQTRSVRAIAARWETERVGVAPLGSLHPDHQWSFVWDRRVLVARRHLARSSSHIGLIRGYVAVFNEDRPVGRRSATGSPGRVDDGWRSESPMGSLQ